MYDYEYGVKDVGTYEPTYDHSISTPCEPRSLVFIHIIRITSYRPHKRDQMPLRQFRVSHHLIHYETTYQGIIHSSDDSLDLNLLLELSHMIMMIVIEYCITLFWSGYVTRRKFARRTVA